MRRRIQIVFFLLFGGLFAFGVLGGIGSTALGWNVTTADRTQPVATENGWLVDGLTTDVVINHDDSLRVTETINVDFANLQKHGIYRDIPIVYDYDAHYFRVLEISDLQVSDNGSPADVATSQRGGVYELKIGNANQLVSGKQNYQIAYTVRGALNSFPDHVELYWNATGNQWAVPIQQAAANVHYPSGSAQHAACFEGYIGSTTPCQSAAGADSSVFTATQPLNPGAGLTVVVGLSPAAVATPSPILQHKPRSLPEMFPFDLPDLLGFAVVLGAGIGLLGWFWWRHARDHEYRTAYYTNHDPAAPDDTAPLFSHRPVVPEFEPPDGLRPGELGVILDETADTKDVTATIIDLAARGFLRIRELPDQGLFGRSDHQLEMTPNIDPTPLKPFERVIYDGLFQGGQRPAVKLSDLRGTFADTLNGAEDALYKDVLAQKWFASDPRTARLLWLLGGIVVIIAGGLLAVVLGATAGLGLIGVALVIVGGLAAVFHNRMIARTAAGHELLYRTLGFRMYMTTAERYMAQFAEKEKIFTAGLPYAIVFGCCDKWAHAFAGVIDVAAAAGGWYVGATAINATDFSRNLEGFSSTVSSTIAFVPAATGGSGFSGGGFSGGGMGGGGGGSW
ncbi:MAG TPA: DUF2207 domain-containing protein [Candidatus Dormibacteraeota bacterium]